MVCRLSKVHLIKPLEPDVHRMSSPPFSQEETEDAPLPHSDFRTFHQFAPPESPRFLRDECERLASESQEASG
ncbi:hypothetical protein PBY51_022075 [Eleginops maclovinus]|uniref:Uncharacterized protein n=1 Tax=Eleginops maclovinus TaxID=56733 RepID=A0AAN7XG51_ELEMC|nr:hypothetical protein PBY51_022075 [Eleginops maclovinus]